MDLNVEPPLPATVFPERRLKSNLGDAMKLMLSSFQRVPRVSALVPEPCRRWHAAARRKPRARASVSRRRAPPLPPALLNPPMAAPSPAAHRSAATRRRRPPPHAVADRRRALLLWAARLRPPSAALRPPQGMIDEPYEGRATGAKPEDDVGGHIPKTDGWNPMCMTKGRCSPSEYHLTNTDLVLIPGIEANQDSHQWARCDVLTCS